jgi:hypothetical protein
MKNALLFFHFLAIVWGQSCTNSGCDESYSQCLNDGRDMSIDHICECYGSLGQCYSSQNCLTNEEYQQFLDTCQSYGCPSDKCQFSGNNGYPSVSDPCSVAQVGCGADYDTCISQGYNTCTCSDSFQSCMLNGGCQIDLVMDDSCNTPTPPITSDYRAHIHVGGFFLLAGIITLCCCAVCLCCRACRRRNRRSCSSQTLPTTTTQVHTQTAPVAPQQYMYIPLQNFQPQQTVPMFPVYGQQGQVPHPAYYPMFAPQVPPQQQPRPIAPPQEKQ